MATAPAGAAVPNSRRKTRPPSARPRDARVPGDAPESAPPHPAATDQPQSSPPSSTLRKRRTPLLPGETRPLGSRGPSRARGCFWVGTGRGRTSRERRGRVDRAPRHEGWSGSCYTRREGGRGHGTGRAAHRLSNGDPRTLPPNTRRDDTARLLYLLREAASLVVLDRCSAQQSRRRAAPPAGRGEGRSSRPPPPKAAVRQRRREAALLRPLPFGEGALMLRDAPRHFIIF